jgi:ABC-type branched-subunit amino acid transport system substrate-binding protein
MYDRSAFQAARNQPASTNDGRAFRCSGTPAQPHVIEQGAESMMIRPAAKYVATVAIAAVLSLMAAACGSNSGSSGSGSGAPIKIMDITTLTSPGQSLNVYPESPAAANAAANAINAHGGIDGHPIQIIVCDDQANPDQAAVCGRDAVSDRVVAATSQSLLSASYIKELVAANIPLVGNAVVGSADFTSPYSFPIGASVLSTYPAGALGLIKDGDTKIGILRIATSLDTITDDATRAGIKSGGGTLVADVAVPTTVTDYGPYAQQLKQAGADGVVLIESEAAQVGVIQAAAEIGYHPKWAIAYGSLTNSQLRQLASLVDGSVVYSTLPLVTDTALPGIKSFIAQMKAEQPHDAAASMLDSTSLGVWLAIYAIAGTLAGAHGDITSTVMLRRLRALHSLSLQGLLTWEPNHKGPALQPRVSTGLIYLSQVQNGTVVSTGQTVNLYGS